MNGGDARDSGNFWRATLAALVGPLVWALHLALVYGGQHLLCARGAAHNTVLWLVIISSIVAVMLLVPLLVASAPVLQRLLGGDQRPEPTQQFLLAIMRLLVLLSLAGIIWAGVAALLLPGCSGPP